ncbi:hypothetical protein M407DRAFT_29663 [Tulasnella calospora MUT 4182]|uniref:Uncharacterized protein n=1 Tax=Tulasnella calospora MUT 4182 TaxID=1051891 RepID=A0A0C3KGU5_9AGAM|nr:hypothetical protein M407DRAFT_29663 [Tulasnella calospora MUT 4182]
MVDALVKAKRAESPASNNTAAVNKAVTLEPAKQIAAVSPIFSHAEDPERRIFAQNLRIGDASAAEIDAAVKGVTLDAAATGNVVTFTVTDGATAASTAALHP